MTKHDAPVMNRLQAFGLAYVVFEDARDRYRQTAAGMDARAMAHVSRLARNVLAVAPTPEEIARATKELGIPAPLPLAAYAAALDEVEFLADPRAYLAKHGEYETAIDGKPVTLASFGNEVLAVGDGDDIARVAGPENVRPVPGGVS